MAPTIGRRLALLVAVAVVTSLTATCIQLGSLRSALFSERQAAIAAQVQTAASIVKNLAAEVEKGRLSETEAQERAKAELRAIRFGHNDYIFVYRPDGQNLVLGPRPELEGKNLMEAQRRQWVSMGARPYRRRHERRRLRLVHVPARRQRHANPQVGLRPKRRAVELGRRDRRLYRRSGRDLLFAGAHGGDLDGGADRRR